MKVVWKKGYVGMVLESKIDGVEVSMKPELALALSNALRDAATRAWVGAYTIPTVTVEDVEV